MDGDEGLLAGYSEVPVPGSGARRRRPGGDGGGRAHRPAQPRAALHRPGRRACRARARPVGRRGARPAAAPSSRRWRRSSSLRSAVPRLRPNRPAAQIASGNDRVTVLLVVTAGTRHGRALFLQSLQFHPGAPARAPAGASRAGPRSSPDRGGGGPPEDARRQPRRSPPDDPRHQTTVAPIAASDRPSGPKMRIAERRDRRRRHGRMKHPVLPTRRTLGSGPGRGGMGCWVRTAAVRQRSGPRPSGAGRHPGPPGARRPGTVPGGSACRQVQAGR